MLFKICHIDLLIPNCFNYYVSIECFNVSLHYCFASLYSLLFPKKNLSPYQV